MKRCPQCEFVYEDDQSLCDMDGSKLAFDSKPLPKLQALATVPHPVMARGAARGRLITTLAGVVLSIVLVLVFYVSTQPQPALEAHGASITQPVELIAEPASQPTEANAAVATEPTAADIPEISQNERSKGRELQEGRTGHDTTSVTRPVAKKSRTMNSPAPKPVRPELQEPKKESKVGSFLKKTGRLLKKPFTF